VGGCGDGVLVMVVKQTDFLDFVDPDVQRIPVQIYMTGDGRYQALVAGGWWMAYGDTPKAAVKNVKRRYEQEIRKLGKGAGVGG